MKFSIIICTYNRDEILSDSINAIINLEYDFGLFEVIVVDNYGKSKTKEIVTSFMNHKNFNIKYLLEVIPGLSFARNSGYKKAIADWIFYLDDDALIDAKYLEFIIHLKI